MSGDKKVDFENANGAEFKNYVLYIIPGEANSQKALGMLEGMQDDVWVQDLRMLQPPLPGWLTGVPTLVPRQDAKAYRGTECLEFLQQMTDEPQGYVSTQTQSMARSFNGADSVTRYESVTGYESQQQDCGERVQDQDIEQYMKQRSAQTEMFKQDPQANAIVAT